MSEIVAWVDRIREQQAATLDQLCPPNSVTARMMRSVFLDVIQDYTERLLENGLLKMVDLEAANWNQRQTR